MSESVPVFRFACVSDEVETDIPPIAEILDRVALGPVWDEGFIAPADGEFPFISIGRTDHEGFVVHCFDQVQSQGHFVVTALDFSDPAVQISLGGQVVEKWPGELIVGRDMAQQALEYFVQTGRRDSRLQWVDTSGFPRETVWEAPLTPVSGS